MPAKKRDTWTDLSSDNMSVVHECDASDIDITSEALHDIQLYRLDVSSHLKSRVSVRVFARTITMHSLNTVCLTGI